MTLSLQLLANGIVNGALFAVMACGFGLVYRSARIFHIAFAGLFILAAYAFFVFREWAGLPVWLALLASLTTSAILGWLTERCFYRPFLRRGATPGSVMVASMGLFIFIENATALAFGNEVRMVSRDLARPIAYGPVTLSTIQLVQFLTATTVLIAFAFAARRLRPFKTIWAMGDEPALVPVLGIPLMRYRTLIFMLSAVLGAIPACLISWDVGINPHVGMTYLLIAAVAVLAGGLDRYGGWILGGIVLALLQSVVIWQVSASWVDLVTFAILIAVLTLRPQGILGHARRLEESNH